MTDARARQPEEERLLAGEYLDRIRALALRQKMKRFFVESQIVNENRLRRNSIMKILSNVTLLPLESDELKLKVAHLESFVSSQVITSVASASIGVASFLSLLAASPYLADLATMEVFAIFDHDSNGFISKKEMLMTMLALKVPSNEFEEVYIILPGSYICCPLLCPLLSGGGGATVL